METSNERRQQSAARVAYGLPIALRHEGFHEPFEAECVDLSPGGLSLRSSCLPGVGETLSCQFHAPLTGQHIEVRGEVVWAHLEGHRGGEFGLRFLDIDPTTVALLSEMVAEREVLARKQPSTTDDVQLAQLAVDGTADTFTARMLRRGAGLVTFEQDLSFLKLGRGVSAISGDDVQRGQIASVAVRLDGGTPKLMVTLRYEPSEAPDDAHTRDEAVTAPMVAPVAVSEAPTAPIALGHDTVPDLDTPVGAPGGKYAVTLTEFDAAYRARESDVDALPPMATRSEFDLPSALQEASAVPSESPTMIEAAEDDEPGPALFTADDVAAPTAAIATTQLANEEENATPEMATSTHVPKVVVVAKQAHDDEAVADDVDEDARYEAAAARMLGERAATMAPAAAPQIADAEAADERCDPAVIFKVDESDQDFRPPTAPTALTLVMRQVIALWVLVQRTLGTLKSRAEQTWLPLAKSHLDGVTQRVGPEGRRILALLTQRSWPTLRAKVIGTVGSAVAIAQRVGGRSQKRRTTTGIPVSPVQAAPTVNRRAQVAPSVASRKLQTIALATAAAVGLVLAGYALFSAPDPHVVPVHREIVAAPQPAAAATTPVANVALTAAAPATITPGPAIAINAPATQAPAVQLPPTSALPAPSYEAGRLAPPSYPSIARAPAPTPVAAMAPAVSPTAQATDAPVAAQEGTGAAAIESSVVTSTASANAKRFGAASVHGRHFTLQMSAPVQGITGTADAGGFSVLIEGALSLDRAGPIAAAHGAVARAMILNKGDRAELTIRFKDGVSPKYQVIARGDTVELTIEQ